MGEFNVPAAAYYGANTMRAVLNFPLSELRFSRSFIEAISNIKLAAAQTNMELGLLEEKLGNAIVEAATEVVGGKFDDQFVVDIFQTGSTLKEITKVLYSKGQVEKVYVLTVTKTTTKSDSQ